MRGVQLLADYGLSFDLGIYHIQLASATELVRRCPETSFILDHIGKPDIRGKQMDPWRSQIDALAALPNVVCKVSGIATEAEPHTWTVEDIAPYVEHVLGAFGEDRVLYGGDWPVVLNASTYLRWAEALNTITESRPAQFKRKLWHDNARRVYRLDDDAVAD